MQKSDVICLKHIIDAIEKIGKYLRDVNYELFVGDDMMFDAVVKELEIVGEASNSISDDFKSEHAGIAWGKIIGMRNILIHEYFGVDPEVVWKTSRDDLPKLKGQLENIIEVKK